MTDFFLRNTTFVSSASLIVHKNYKLIDPFNVSLIDAVSKYAIWNSPPSSAVLENRQNNFRWIKIQTFAKGPPEVIWD